MSRPPLGISLNILELVWPLRCGSSITWWVDNVSSAAVCPTCRERDEAVLGQLVCVSQVYMWARQKVHSLDPAFSLKKKVLRPTIQPQMSLIVQIDQHQDRTVEEGRVCNQSSWYHPGWMRTSNRIPGSDFGGS